MVFRANPKSDKLTTGPSPTPSLFAVLSRFRSHNIALMADIEKAFLQISLHPDGRDYFRFIWFKDSDHSDFEAFENNVLIELRLCRVLFGTPSSPFLLTGTLIKHASSYADIDTDSVEKLLQPLRVDDSNSGASTDTGALDFSVKCKERLREGGFSLQKFESNSQALEAQICSQYDHQESTRPRSNKILLPKRDKGTDLFVFDFKDNIDKSVQPYTKRNVLHTIASIYDPLGIINPVVLRMKILMQGICGEKHYWDDPLTGMLLQRWETIFADLNEAPTLQVIRNYAFNDHNDPFVKIQLHSFSDAFKKVYLPPIPISI